MSETSYLEKLRSEVAAPASTGAAPPAEDLGTHPVFGYRITNTPFPPRVQPENDVRVKSFQVGDRCAHTRERLALPEFRYPEPGKPMTEEISKAENHYAALRSLANQRLNDLIVYYKLRVWLDDEETSNSVGVAERERLRQENRRFLEGVWQSLGYDAPSDEQIQKWAEEDLEHAKTAKNNKASTWPLE
jgi:hypothetical protein